MELRVAGHGVHGVIEVDDRELRWRFSRAGGPGGQGVNTADSRVEVSWDVARSASLPADLRERVLAGLAHRLVDGVVTLAASEHRAQLQNRRAAVARLAALVEGVLVERAPRRPTRPSRASRVRRATAEQQRRAVKELRRRPPRRSGPE